LRVPSLTPYLPRLAIEWGEHDADRLWQAIDGTLVFVDISGFTALSERLAKRGRVGGEELTEVLSACFAELLAVAYASGGSLIKFGGDALLLLFDGAGHPERAATSAIRMRETMGRVGRLTTSVGAVRLRMSVGVHSGTIHAFRVGGSHKELLLTGPAASQTVAMEAAADAGEILVSPATAAALPATFLGNGKGDGVLLRRKRLGAPEHLGHLPVPPTTADLRHAVPVGLRHHLLSGDAEAEHRHATVAFIHFDGTDDLLAAAGPDAVATALDALVREVQAAAEAYDVTFLGSDIDRDGGKIILVGGAPSASDDDAGQVLRAVRRVADAAGALPVRIGVNRGHVFAGEVGPSYRRTYTVMGDAVNLAARLMARAGHGEVLVKETVVDLARTRFATAPLPPFMVKGKSQPVHALAVGEVLGARTDRGLSDALPFTGRERELRVLLDAAAASELGRGRLVEIVGESGIGKSRLLDEVRRRSGALRSIEVVCEPYETRTPYQALRPLLATVLSVPFYPDADDLARAVAAIDGELLPWLPLLGHVFSIDVPATDATADLEPRFRRERTAWFVVELLGRVVTDPTIVVFDDAQWMDDSSSGVVRLLGEHARHRPWLLCVVRSDAPGGFEARGDVTRISLLPLDDDAATALVTAATRGTPLPPHRRDGLVARAGGNPLFLGELLLAGTADDSGSEADAGLPETLEAVVAAQIDRLDRDDRRVLRHAAVLGMVFDPELLAGVVDPDLEGLARAAAERLDGFVERMGGFLRFRNQCTRDVAYGMLPFRRRRELHGRAALAIEARTPRPDDRAEVLSLHLLHAERYDDCWHYARVGADRAAAKYANLEAAELCERALAAGTRVEEVGSDDVACTWEQLADLSSLAGMYDRARAALAKARRLRAGQPVALARLYSKEAELASRRQQARTAARWITRGLSLLADADDAEAVSRRASLRVKRAELYQEGGHNRDALRCAEEGRAEAEAAGNLPALAQAYNVLDWVHMTLGRPDRATHGPAALAIWEQLGNLGSQAVVLNNLGAFAYYRGEWDAALDYYRRGRDVNLRIGNAADAGIGTCNIAEILIDQGRLDEAEPALRETAALWRSLGYAAAVAYATRYLGRIAVKRGDLDEADRLLEEARQAFAAQGQGAKVLEVDAWRAECLLRRGEITSALVLINDALHREATGGDTTLASMLHRLRAYAYAGLDRLADAWAEVDESLHVARSRGAAFDIALALETLSVLAELGGLPADSSAEEERAALLAALGVATTAPPPLYSALRAG
jgi:class 3 adenylate cyclase/tetratricopeptide (TPR) repeat protein